MESKKHLSGLEKFAYGIGAVGKDMVYMLSASYVLYYFQDIMGINTIAMGIILLIARVFDAFNDPIMGVVVAKTKTKWGKFRPWLMIGTITNAVLLFVMFSAPPSLSGSGLIAYAAVTYILWGVTYTMMDIPYWSMIPAFTESGKEREGLSALARSCAGVGSALVTIITVMVVASLGNAMVAKSTDKVTEVYDSADMMITPYAVAIDADGNAISDVRPLEGNLTITVTGSEKLFEEELGLTSGNTSQEIVVNADANVDHVEFATEGDEGLIVFYVTEDTIDTIDALDFEATVDLTSTVEVERYGFKYFSLIIAILFVLFITITCVCIKEKSSVDMQSASIGDMFKALIQNDQAMTIVITIVLINTATYITSNLLIYFFKYDLAGSNWQGNYTLFNTFAGGMQILAMMILFPLLRKAFDTLKIFYLCVASAITGYIILLFMALGGVTSVYLFFIPGFLIMAAVGILNVVVTIFLANTVDYGEFKNGRRDESVIFSMQTFVVKLASGIAALVASVCLAVFNIQENSDAVMSVETLRNTITDLENAVVATIDNSAVIGLRSVMTIGPTLVLVIALLIFRKKYILNEKKMNEITAAISK